MQRVLFGLLPSGTGADAAPSGGATDGGGIDPRKDRRVRKEKDEDDAEKGGEKTKKDKEQGRAPRN